MSASFSPSAFTSLTSLDDFLGFGGAEGTIADSRLVVDGDPQSNSACEDSTENPNLYLILNKKINNDPVLIYMDLKTN